MTRSSPIPALIPAGESGEAVVKYFPTVAANVTFSDMTSLPPESIEEYPWMLGIAQGDEECLKLLIQKWQKPVYHFFYRFLHEKETAEDLTQNVFIRIYRAAPSYQPSARFSSYIFHIARKVLYNEFRRRKRKPSTGLEDLSHSDQEAALLGTDASSENEWQEWVQNALQQLPDRQKEALLLHIQQGLPYEEVSQVMESSVSTVKSLIFRARQHLKSLLNQNF